MKQLFEPIIDAHLPMAEPIAAWSRLLHELNQRYKREFDRAECLQAELTDIKASRAYPLFAWLRRCFSLLKKGQKPITNDNPTINLSQFQSLNEPLELQPLAGLVSIVIPFRDQWPLLHCCLISLRQIHYPRLEIILIDNGSRAEQTLQGLQVLANEPNIRIIRVDEPFNFARLCNRGAAIANGQTLLFLNNDVLVIEPQCLQSLLEPTTDQTVGVVGGMLLYPNQTVQHAGLLQDDKAHWFHPFRYRRFPNEMQDVLKHAYWRVPAVTGACLGIRRDRFAQLGGFDERWPTDFNDVDLCQRATQQNWKVLLSTQSIWVHYESFSRGYRKESQTWQPG